MITATPRRRSIASILPTGGVRPLRIEAGPSVASVVGRSTANSAWGSVASVVARTDALLERR
jgi:hypothetical protein